MCNILIVYILSIFKTAEVQRIVFFLRYDPDWIQLKYLVFLHITLILYVYLTQLAQLYKNYIRL